LPGNLDVILNKKLVFLIQFENEGAIQTVVAKRERVIGCAHRIRDAGLSLLAPRALFTRLAVRCATFSYSGHRSIQTTKQHIEGDSDARIRQVALV
jgi:hypothetical protein